MAAPLVKVGIMGMGGIGGIHAESLGAFRDDVALVAYTGGREESGADFGWPMARRLGPAQLLAAEDVDLVVICTPSGEHGRHALQAVEAGKQIVVEKPFSTDLATGRRVLAEAARRSLFVGGIAQRRFSPEARYLKSLLDRGELGRVVLGEVLVHWYRTPEYYEASAWRKSMEQGGGSLFNQGLHDVDLIEWMLGPVARVTAQYGTQLQDIDAEDTTVATLGFASGALGMIVTSTATPPGAASELRIFTSLGSIALTKGEVVTWSIPGVPPPTELSTVSGAADPLAIGTSGHVAQWRDIISAIREGRAPLVSGEAALGTVRLIRGIYQAASTGRRVELESV